MSARDLVVGVDIGGTNVKAGIVDLATNEVLASCGFPTNRDSEQEYLASLCQAVDRLSSQVGRPRGAGVSIGSYVFADGSIDGMSSFVPFLVHGYPLARRLEEALYLPVRVDNDARLICLAEARDGAGKGYSRVLTMTLGTGVGVGLCEDGRPFGGEPFIHLAGHVKVRAGGEYPCLDRKPCYCGLEGCLESTCSGSSFQAFVHDLLGTEVTNEDAFERAAAGDEAASEAIAWYLDMLARALNQYVYLYCPDVIVIGGGVASGLERYEDDLNNRIVAEVYEGQRTRVKITSLKEDSGILGAASLFAGDAIADVT